MTDRTETTTTPGYWRTTFERIPFWFAYRDERRIFGDDSFRLPWSRYASVKQMMEIAYLKPCPFCGGQARVSGLGYSGPADCYDVKVICDGCDAQTASFIVDQHSSDVGAIEAEVAAQAAAAWNRRHT